MLDIKKYNRKPFPVRAVEITAENMEEVAEWCRGKIREEGAVSEPVKFIKVDVHNALSDRQTQGYIGDFVLQDQNRRGFKIYTAQAFAKSFDLIAAEGEKRKPAPPKNPVLTPEMARKIAEGKEDPEKVLTLDAEEDPSEVVTQS